MSSSAGRSGGVVFYVGALLVMLSVTSLMSGLATTHWGSGTNQLLKTQLHLGLFQSCVANAGPLTGCERINRHCEVEDGSASPLTSLSNCHLFNTLRGFAIFTAILAALHLILTMVTAITSFTVSSLMLLIMGLIAGLLGCVTTILWSVYRSRELRGIDHDYSMGLWTAGWVVLAMGAMMHAQGVRKRGYAAFY